MGESSSSSSHHHKKAPPSRLGPRSGCGEIVEVQGGHIVRSTGRKDRHSKVCTAKGPRDRRVRLAAHTAIQFYDVQDRLGYDRPSKAVDWLIKKAKSAIDELEQLPPWHPTSQNVQKEAQKTPEEVSGSYGKRQMLMLGGHHQNNPSFLPASLDSDAIADTIKSFFPVGASAELPSSSSMQFQSFPTPDLLSGNNQDLRLSLQSFQDPILLHHHHQSQQHHSQPQSQVLLSGTPLGFEGAASWAEHHQQAVEVSRFQRLTAWNSDSSGGSGGAAAGFLFNSPQLFGHSQYASQRGPLQSSNTSSIRAWMDPPSEPSQQQHHHHLLPAAVPIYPSSMQGLGFASGVGGFSGFPIPARIQGDVEDHDGYSDKPSSASSDSRH